MQEFELKKKRKKCENLEHEVRKKHKRCKELVSVLTDCCCESDGRRGARLLCASLVLSSVYLNKEPPAFLLIWSVTNSRLWPLRLELFSLSPSCGLNIAAEMTGWSSTAFASSRRHLTFSQALQTSNERFLHLEMVITQTNSLLLMHLICWMKSHLCLMSWRFCRSYHSIWISPFFSTLLSSTGWHE